MLLFQKLTLEQAPLLRSYFKQNPDRLCDRTLGGALMWRNAFQTRFAHVEDTLLLESCGADGRVVFAPPLGDFEKGVFLLREYTQAHKIPLIFCSVGERDKERLFSLDPNFTVEATRDWFDYLYDKKNLIGFPGKKMSGQRNHRNAFLKQNDNWSFEYVTKESLPLVRAFFLEQNAGLPKDSSFYAAERDAVLEVMENWDTYGFFGGMILVEGRIVAFSFGEIVEDTIFVHVEKALREVRGSYQMIVSEFLSHFAHEGVHFVNREEDVGDPGLRYSKEAYHPERLIEKYMVGNF